MVHWYLATIWINPMSPAPQSRIARFTLDRPAAAALDLFTAEGERAWAPGWDPECLSGSGNLPGSTFVTYSPEGMPTHWIVLTLDRTRHRAAYARFAAGLHTGLIEVDLSESAPSSCEVRVRYTLTPISAAGQSQLSDLLEPDRFATFITGWKGLIE